MSKIVQVYNKTSASLKFLFNKKCDANFKMSESDLFLLCVP